MDIRELSPEQLAGQRMMVGFDGTRLDSDLKYLIDTLKVGGIILFRRNVGSPDQVRQLCHEAQTHARACGQPPLFIAIDQEGGPVARLKKPFTEFDGNPSMKGEADARRFARITADELSGVGINMNYAPVLDVAPEEIDSIMADRAFGHDPDWVARMGETVIGHLQQRGIMAVAKHFPGIGRTTLDSHMDLPVLETSLADMEAFDLIPFMRAIHAGVAGIMLSHIRYPRIDADWPASLSPFIVRNLLRGRFQYDGVVMTDDLDMGAITKHFDFQTAIAQTLLAGIDLVLICHRSSRIEFAFEQIVRMNERRNEINMLQTVSLQRIMTLKARYLDLML